MELRERIAVLEERRQAAEGRRMALAARANVVEARRMALEARLAEDVMARRQRSWRYSAPPHVPEPAVHRGGMPRSATHQDNSPRSTVAVIPHPDPH